MCERWVSRPLLSLRLVLLPRQTGSLFPYSHKLGPDGLCPRIPSVCKTVALLVWATTARKMSLVFNALSSKGDTLLSSCMCLLAVAVGTTPTFLFERKLVFRTSRTILYFANHHWSSPRLVFLIRHAKNIMTGFWIVRTRDAGLI